MFVVTTTALPASSVNLQYYCLANLLTPFFQRHGVAVFEEQARQLLRQRVDGNFWSSFKRGLIHRRHFATRAKAPPRARLPISRGL